MEQEVNSGVVFGLMLMALVTILGILFGIFAIAKGQAGVSLEDVKKLEETRKDIDFETIKIAASIAWYKIQQKAGAIIALTLAITLEYKRRKKSSKFKKDRMISAFTKNDMHSKILRYGLPMIDIPNNYVDGDQLITIFNTDSISIVQYIKKKVNIDSKDVHIIKHGRTFKINGVVQKSGAYYKIDNVMIPRKTLALVDGQEYKLTVYAKFTDIYKLRGIPNGYLLTDFDIVEMDEKFLMI